MITQLEALDTALHGVFMRRRVRVDPRFAWRLWDRCTARGAVQDNDAQIHLAERLLLQIGVR